MNLERWQEVERLFHAALELAESSREAYLRSETNDEEVRDEVRALLEHDDPAFLSGVVSLPSVGSEVLRQAVGSYLLQEELGRGGMGVVYRALDLRLDRPVAIKFLLDPLLESVRERSQLEAEARILAQFNHPHIATIYSVESTSDGRVFLVLELIEGTNLARRLDHGPLELSHAFEVAEQIARALQVAHRRGITHGDLKPENVVLDPEGAAKLLDFGLGRFLGTEGSGGRTPVWGTPGYLSPEALQGASPDERSDAFAFGSLFYECLTGTPAFPGGDADAIREATLHAHPDWSALPRGLAPGMRTILERCLEKNPNARLPDLSSVVDALAAARRTTPSRAVAPIPEERPSLPAPASSFIGRLVELNDLGALRTETRLLTVTGAGGSGKTRLALEFARRHQSGFGDGAWFVEFASIADAAQVGRAILDALGAMEEAQRSPLETALRSVRAKQGLLILDNCEHVLEGAAGAAETLLAGAPQLFIVATSRAPLGLPAESTYPVPPLAEALELFASRARSARPGFRITDENRASIEAICRRVEGNPLAIELVAARVRTQAPSEIAARLQESFDLVGRSAGGGVPRHRTLRATFEWSYGLLGEDERMVLRRLSVLVGEWDLTAAEAVAGDASSVPTEDVLPVLTSLVEKSLVLHRLDDAGTSRYRLLEPERQYALEALERSEGAETARERHVRFFAASAREAGRHIRSEEQERWLRDIDESQENIQAALRWTLDSDRLLDQAYVIGGSMWGYWHLRSSYRGGGELLERILRADPTGADAGQEWRAQVLCGAGVLATEQDDHETARRHFEASMVIQERLGLPIAFHLSRLGRIATRVGDHERAREYFERSRDAYRNLSDRHGERGVLRDLATAAITQGDYEVALRTYDALLGDGFETMPAFDRCLVLGNSAYLRCYLGAFPEALDFARRALTESEGAGLHAEGARARINLGRACFYSGRVEEAERELRRAVEETREMDAPFYETFAINYLLPVLAARPANQSNTTPGDLEEREASKEHADRSEGEANEVLDTAETFFARGLELSHAAGLIHAEISCLAEGARIALARGRVEDALQRSSRAVSLLESRPCIEGAEEEIYLVHHECLVSCGRAPEAREAARQAARWMQAKADRLHDVDLRSTFFDHPSNRRIREAVRGADGC